MIFSLPLYLLLISENVFAQAPPTMIVDETPISEVPAISVPIYSEPIVTSPIPGQDRVFIFSSNFVQAVEDSQLLYNALGLAIEEILDRDAFYNVIYDESVIFENPDPSDFTAELVDVVTDVHNSLTPTLLAEIISTAVGRVLNDVDILTTEQAVSLSKTYAYNFELAILSNNEIPIRAAHIKAIADGIFALFEELRIVSPLTAFNLMYYLIEEFTNLRFRV